MKGCWKEELEVFQPISDKLQLQLLEPVKVKIKSEGHEASA